MNKKDQIWTLFWCELLSPIIYGDIVPEGEHAFLVELSKIEMWFPNGTFKKPSLSTLKRKLATFRENGFDALARQTRSDIGVSRTVSQDIIDYAIALKKDQPKRSDRTINEMLLAGKGQTLSRSTLYRHLERAGATKIKLDISKKKIRSRWTTEHPNDIWEGDMADGPYVLYKGNAVPTYLSAIIDCHSRFIVDARYYLRENLDVLVHSLLNALGLHGAPLALYFDNAKIYHSRGLKIACFKMNTRLIHRPKKEPEPGGLIERFIQTTQNIFEAEVRASMIKTLEELNRDYSAWITMSYHQQKHAETGEAPEERYKKGLIVTRQVDLSEILAAFMHVETRKVNATFSDIQLFRKFFKVDPRLRGDKVEVRFDPFSSQYTVEIYSLTGEYLGKGIEHHREKGGPTLPKTEPDVVRYSYLDLLRQQHQTRIDEEVRGFDIPGSSRSSKLTFYDFAQMLARLLNRRGGLSAFHAGELEEMNKLFEKNPGIDREALCRALERASEKTVSGVLSEIKMYLKGE